jgi:hypothetical protein
MNRIKSAGIAVTVIMVSWLASCSKENKAPVINWQSPVDSTVVATPDSVHLKGTITDDRSLHEVSIAIYNDSTTDTIFKLAPYVHDLKVYTYTANYFPDTTVKGNYTLLVTAADHEGGYTTLTRRVIINK